MKLERGEASACPYARLSARVYVVSVYKQVVDVDLVVNGRFSHFSDRSRGACGPTFLLFLPFIPIRCPNTDEMFHFVLPVAVLSSFPRLALSGVLSGS